MVVGSSGHGGAERAVAIRSAYFDPTGTGSHPALTAKGEVFIGLAIAVIVEAVTKFVRASVVAAPRHGCAVGSLKIGCTHHYSAGADTFTARRSQIEAFICSAIAVIVLMVTDFDPVGVGGAFATIARVVINVAKTIGALGVPALEFARTDFNAIGNRILNLLTTIIGAR